MISAVMRVSHLALVAMYENRVITPIHDLDQRCTDDVFGDVIKGFLASTWSSLETHLVAWYAKLLDLSFRHRESSP